MRNEPTWHVSLLFTFCLFTFQASKGKDVEFDGVSDLPSDNESMNTDKPSLDRQGSIQVPWGQKRLLVAMSFWMVIPKSYCAFLQESATKAVRLEMTSPFINSWVFRNPIFCHMFFSVHNDLLRSCHLYNGKIIDKTFNNANCLIRHGLMSL